MSKVQPIKEFEIEFAKRVDQETGESEDVKYNFILSFKKPIGELQGEVEGMQKFLLTDVGGIDNIKMAGRYAVEVIVARCFDPDDVVAAIEAGIGALQSDLIRPELVTD